MQPWTSLGASGTGRNFIMPRLWCLRICEGGFKVLIEAFLCTAQLPREVIQGDCMTVPFLHLCRKPSAPHLLQTAWLHRGPHVQHRPLLPGRLRERALWPPARHQGEGSELLCGFARCGRAGRVPRNGPCQDLSARPDPGLQQHLCQLQEGLTHPQRSHQHRQGAPQDQQRVWQSRREADGAKHRWVSFRKLRLSCSWKMLHDTLSLLREVYCEEKEEKTWAKIWTFFCRSNLSPSSSLSIKSKMIFLIREESWALFVFVQAEKQGEKEVHVES